MKTVASLDLKNYKTNDQKTINNKFLGACTRGDINAMDFLLNNESLPFRAQLSLLSKEAMNTTCLKNQVEALKYLLKYHEDNDIPIVPPDCFTFVCQRSYIDIITFMCEQPSLQNDKTMFVKGCATACRRNQLEAVKFFLFSPKIDPPISSIHADNDSFFKEAFNGNAKKVLTWLIVEQEIKIYPGLKNWIANQNTSYTDVKPFVLDLLAKREFKDTMENILIEKSSGTKLKI